MYNAFIDRVKANIQRCGIDENFKVEWEKIVKILPQDLVKEIHEFIPKIANLNNVNNGLEGQADPTITTLMELCKKQQEQIDTQGQQINNLKHQVGKIQSIVDKFMAHSSANPNYDKNVYVAGGNKDFTDSQP